MDTIAEPRHASGPIKCLLRAHIEAAKLAPIIDNKIINADHEYCIVLLPNV